MELVFNNNVIVEWGRYKTKYSVDSGKVKYVTQTLPMAYTTGYSAVAVISSGNPASTDNLQLTKFELGTANRAGSGTTFSLGDWKWITIGY